MFCPFRAGYVAADNGKYQASKQISPLIREEFLPLRIRFEAVSSTVDPP